MEILYILVPLGIILLALAIWAFFWAVKNDQFDDMEGPAYSILFDDTDPSTTKEDGNSSTDHTHSQDTSSDQAPLIDTNSVNKNDQ